jgi:hypothetical protein
VERGETPNFIKFKGTAAGGFFSLYFRKGSCIPARVVIEIPKDLAPGVKSTGK